MSRKWAVCFRRGARGVARFRRAHDGATAVEFAMVFPLFIATLVAIFEVCIFLFAQQMLQTVAVDVGRLLMTGQGMTQSEFTTTFCPKLQPIFTCASIGVDVQSYNSYGSAVTSCPASGYAPSINPGTPGQIVIIRLIYPWTVYSALGFSMTNFLGCSNMLGVTAIRVEPS